MFYLLHTQLHSPNALHLYRVTQQWSARIEWSYSGLEGRASRLARLHCQLFFEKKKFPWSSLFAVKTWRHESISGRGKGGRVKGKSKSAPAGLDCSFHYVVFIDLLGKAITRSVLLLEFRCIWQLSWLTWKLRFSSWPEMLRVTTKRPGSSHAICN